MSEKVPILVVLGIDTDGRWHASRFAESDAALVTRAAELMGFHVVRITSENEELDGIAEALPVGKIFASGRAFVLFVARAFEKLRALVEGGVIVEAPSGQPADVQPTATMFTTEAATAADALWSKVEIGTVVLAAQPDLYGPGGVRNNRGLRSIVGIRHKARQSIARRSRIGRNDTLSRDRRAVDDASELGPPIGYSLALCCSLLT